MKNIYISPECALTPLSAAEIITASELRFSQVVRFGDEMGMGMGDEE